METLNRRGEKQSIMINDCMPCRNFFPFSICWPNFEHWLSMCPKHPHWQEKTPLQLQHDSWYLVKYSDVSSFDRNILNEKNVDLQTEWNTYIHIIEHNRGLFSCMSAIFRGLQRGFCPPLMLFLATYNEMYPF